MTVVCLLINHILSQIRYFQVIRGHQNVVPSLCAGASVVLYYYGLSFIKSGKSPLDFVVQAGFDWCFVTELRSPDRAVVCEGKSSD